MPPNRTKYGVAYKVCGGVIRQEPFGSGKFARLDPGSPVNFFYNVFLQKVLMIYVFDNSHKRYYTYLVSPCTFLFKTPILLLNRVRTADLVTYCGG
jgi:hypothetical protein